MMILRSLSNNEYKINARNELRRLYGIEFPDPYTYAFFEQTEKSILLMDYSGYFYGKHLDALKASGVGIGDDGFFLTDPSNQANELEDGGYYVQHWYVPFDDSSNYGMRTEAFIYRPIHYSPQGVWGIIATDDNFGILSGPTRFIDDFCLRVPEIKNDTNNFLAYWINAKSVDPKLDVSWVSIILENIYGIVQAKKFLLKAEWSY